MSGDVSSSVMNNANNASDWKKYTAWLKYKGLTKLQARNEYARTLLEILDNNYPASKYPEVISLKTHLRNAYDSNIIAYDVSAKNDVTLDNNFKPPTTAPVQQSIPRSHSPAASLYRFASAGVSSNLIRPPSRNQSFSRSRQNSITSKNNIVANNNVNTNTHANNVNSSEFLNDMSSNLNTSNSQTLYNVTGGVIPSSVEFLKWQGEINNTLLKISTELNNLKNQRFNDIELDRRVLPNHSPTAATLEIPNFKLRSQGLVDKDRVSSMRQYSDNGFGSGEIDYSRESFKDKYRPWKNSQDGDDNENNTGIGQAIKIMYMKLRLFLRYLVQRVELYPMRGVMVITSLLAVVFLGLVKRLIGKYATQRGIRQLERGGMWIWPSLMQWWRFHTGSSGGTGLSWAWSGTDKRTHLV